jgi:hypothetical protein
MGERNRVTPFGTIEALDQRGLFLGNRGSIHGTGDDARTIRRPWQVRRWITCVLEYKDWVAPKWQPGRWTPLFFWDEPVALAAGHRPCALCRHADHVRWLDAWEAAHGDRPKVDPMDRRLHDERTAADRPRRPWRELPDDTYVVVDDVAHLVVGDDLWAWTPTLHDRYEHRRPRPTTGDATLLTPPSTVAVLQAGYVPRRREAGAP